MTTPRVTRLALGGLCALLALALTSCQDRDFGLTIVQVQNFDIDACEVVTDQTVGLASGSVDIAVRSGYSAFLLLRNNMLRATTVKAFDETDSRIDTNSIVLKRAVVQYTSLTGLDVEVGQEKRIALSGTIELEGTTIVPVEVLTDDLITQLRSSEVFLTVDDSGQLIPSTGTTVQLIARIRIEGETLDGKDVESNEFLFPIEICVGCSVFFAYDDVTDTYFCPAIDETDPTLATLSCGQRLGVDGNSVDCRFCPRLVPRNSPLRLVCNPDF